MLRASIVGSWALAVLLASKPPLYVLRTAAWSLSLPYTLEASTKVVMALYCCLSLKLSVVAMMYNDSFLYLRLQTGVDLTRFIQVAVRLTHE